ncbi:MAG: glutaredoxin [Rhizobium sp.]|nr:glutaredoxin [Rhizobium sp.]
MAKQATLYRMVMETHTCPWGLKSKHLLESQGYKVDDRWLRTREETDAFKAEHDVKTTPQTFIDGKRVGGYDDLRRHFGKPVTDPKATTYKPVIAVFAMTALMALAASYAAYGDALTIRAAEWFIAFSMCVLAILKLQNIETFSTMFLNYDLLAKRWVPYGYVYPFAEEFAGVLMISGALVWLSVPVALFIGTIGAVSVFKAVYIDRRELKCACVGGGSNVPLGFVSLTENVMMVLMAIWMVLMTTGTITVAQEMDGHDMSTMEMSAPADAAGKAYMDGMVKMNKDMAAPMTGDADTDFAAMMVPHHQGAIDMAKVQLQYGKDADLKKLSSDIIKAQESEIAFMNGWLAKNAKPADHASHEDPAGKAYMDGMAKMNKDMNAAMTGDPDRDFVTMMVPHHQGAIDMAKVQLQYGKDPELRKLSEGVVKAQESEIAYMKDWLAKH